MQRNSKLAVPTSLCYLIALALSFTVGCCVLSPASAQTSAATVTGLVKDSTGANVGGAIVTLINVDTNVSRATVSNASGNYTVGNVPPGHYTLQFSAAGFQAENVKDFELTVNQTLTVEAALKVGNVDTSVTVEAAGTTIESSTAQLGTVIRSEAGQRPSIKWEELRPTPDPDTRRHAHQRGPEFFWQ